MVPAGASQLHTGEITLPCVIPLQGRFRSAFRTAALRAGQER